MQTACRTAARLHRSLEQTTQLIQDLSSQLIEGLDDDSDGFNLSKDPSSRAKKRKPKPAAAKKSLAAIGGVGSGLGDPPEADEVQETGTLRQACIAQEILQRTTSQYLEEMLGRVFRSAGEQARELLAHTRARAAEQQKLTSAVFQEQMRARDSAAAAWRQYMKASEERQRLTLMNTPLQEDPYLACRDYARAMAQLGSMDTQYRQTMAEWVYARRSSILSVWTVRVYVCTPKSASIYPHVHPHTNRSRPPIPSSASSDRPRFPWPSLLPGLSCN